MNDESPKAAISVMYLLYGPETGSFFVFLWWLTAPLALLRPIVQWWMRAKEIVSH